MSSQLISSEPKPGEEVCEEMVTPSVCSSVSSVWSACGGMTTV